MIYYQILLSLSRALLLHYKYDVIINLILENVF